MEQSGSTSPNTGIRPSWPRRHPWLTAVAGLILGLVALLLLFSVLPVRVADESTRSPLAGFEEAERRVADIRAAEEARGDLNPICYTNALTHGERTAEVIVIFHGLTSCPEQFRELAEQLHSEGYNVYVPRLPYHGAADRLGEMLLNNSAEELATFATESIDIGHGLGEDVIVMGLSGGGTLAAWVAQTHDDVEESVLIAPFLGIGFIPELLNRPLARFFDDIPNIWMWWDPRSKADNPLTAAYAYPRYPLHALAEYLRLGFATQQLARSDPPAAAAIRVITNANDESVHNGIAKALVKTWQQHNDVSVQTYEFARELGLPHDMITPTRLDAQPDLTYPIILESINGR